jgi:hypothetical protein
MYGTKYNLVYTDVCTVKSVEFNIDKMAVLLDVTLCKLVQRPNELAAYISMDVYALYEVHKYSQTKQTHL